MSEHWIIIGDSLVAGSHPDFRAKESLAYYLMHHYDVNISLLASGGQTMTGQASLKLPKAVEYIDGPLRTVDKVIIALGTNDWAMEIFGVGISREAFCEAYKSFLTALPNHLNVYCVTPLPRADENNHNLQGWPLSIYREDTNRVALETGAIILDGSQVFETASLPNFVNDGIHLTPEGTRAYADWLWQEIMGQEVMGKEKRA